MKNVINYLEKNKIFEKGERVAVAVSGGADSIALLYFLCKNKARLEIDPICLNIDHSIRGEESQKESIFVKNFAQSLGVEFFSTKIDVPEFADSQKLTLEQAARILRYKTLYDMADKQKTSKICVAHHKDDQAETILMHIFRGSGLKGATGMSYVTNQRLIRPLLYTSRVEIEEYLANNNIEYINDSSNKDIKFNRNFIRHVVIKNIKEIYPAIVDNLAVFSKNCRSDEEFINSCLPKNIIKQKKDSVKILDKAKNLHESLLSRVIRNAFAKIGSLVDVEQKHIELITDLFDLQVGKKLDLPNSVVAQRDYDGLIFYKNNAVQPQIVVGLKLDKFKFDNFGRVEIAKHIGSVEYKPNTHYIDADKLPQNCLIRTRKEGDKFSKFGGGTKSLSDYFIDKKMPVRQRDFVPLIAKGNEVFVVLGSEISEAVKIDKATKNIIRIIVHRGRN